MPSPNRSHTMLTVITILAVFLVVFSLTLKPSSDPGFLRKVVLEAIGPLEYTVNSTLKCINQVWERYIFLVDLEKRNRELNEKVLLLKKEINRNHEIYLECMRLRKLAGFAENLNYLTIVARVVGRDRSSSFMTVLLNRGTNDGVISGSPVVTSEGVVGKVIESSWNISKVLLLVDYNSNIDALIQGNRVQGILQGCGNGRCNLKYVPRLETINTGEVVISSGLAGVFPKGLLIGTVMDIKKEESGLFQKILVVPAVDVTKLEEVLVIIGGQGNDR